jgi:hypothetical protein
MAPDTDVASLRREELIALVRQLRQQVAERDDEIESLKRQLAEPPAPSAVGKPVRETLPSEPEGSSPGSQEDLLAQLEKVYPGGR